MAKRIPGIVYPGLRAKREAKHLSQAAAGEIFNVTLNTYRLWEQGVRMTPAHYETVVAVFGPPEGGKQE